MEVRRLAASETDELAPLIAIYPFKPYRQYRMLSRRRQDLVLRAEIDRVFAAEGSVALLARDANGSAAIALRPLPWDSEFFGLPMGRLEYLLRAGEDPRAAMRAVVGACTDACRQYGIHHVSARIDASDMDGIETLESHGFGLKDALLTYFNHPKNPPIAELREMGVLRPFRPGDADEVIDIAREAFAGFQGRFHFDRHLPPERSGELYVEWARHCCSGDMADLFYVTENSDGRLIGFLGIRRLEPVSSVGEVPLYGGGLGACRRNSPGAYAGLIRAVVHAVVERGGAAEGQTQNHNFSTVRLYELLGMEYVRAEYTFHAWLGD